MGEGPALNPDAEDFLSRVDEVTSLIDGLKAGTVSPEVRHATLRRELQCRCQQRAERATLCFADHRLP